VTSVKIVCLASCGKYCVSRIAGIKTSIHSVFESHAVDLSTPNQLFLYRGKSCFPVPKLEFQISDEGAESLQRGAKYACDHFLSGSLC
jgi:hypothetical protein